MPPTKDEPQHMEQEVRKRPVPLWRSPDYLLLWSGQTISSIGSGISQLAFPLLVLAITNSPAQAGFAGALRALPYFIFTLPGGALIDRWDRKRVMILCDAGRAVSVASIPAALMLGHLTILQLYLVSLIEGSLFVFFDLAETASLPRVVSKEQLPAAIVQNQVTFGITTLLQRSTQRWSQKPYDRIRACEHTLKIYGNGSCMQSIKGSHGQRLSRCLKSHELRLNAI